MNTSEQIPFTQTYIVPDLSIEGSETTFTDQFTSINSIVVKVSGNSLLWKFDGDTVVGFAKGTDDGVRRLTMSSLKYAIDQNTKQIDGSDLVGELKTLTDCGLTVTLAIDLLSTLSLTSKEVRLTDVRLMIFEIRDPKHIGEEQPAFLQDKEVMQAVHRVRNLVMFESYAIATCFPDEIKTQTLGEQTELNEPKETDVLEAIGEHIEPGFEFTVPTVAFDQFVRLDKYYQIALPIDPRRFGVDVGGVRMEIGGNKLNLSLSTLPGSSYLIDPSKPEVLLLRFDNHEIELNSDAVQEDGQPITGELAKYLIPGFEFHLHLELGGMLSTTDSIIAAHVKDFSLKKISHSDPIKNAEFDTKNVLGLVAMLKATKFIGFCPLIYPIAQETSELLVNESSFKKVADMNVAFGNPKGDPLNIDIQRVHKQCLSIPDEYAELMISMGADEVAVRTAVKTLKEASKLIFGNGFRLDDVRDALCDIHVFAYGAHHYLGIDADNDMHEVTRAVMTRFIKDDEDKAASIEFHAKRGVTEVYFEGEYPKMVMKSSCDQLDAPKGKFLKSASYEQPTLLQY